MITGVGCVVPALDAAPTLPAVISDLRRFVPGACIVVVDDGSQDSTSEIARRLADHVIVHPVNLGKGAALRHGFDFVMSSGCSRILTIDADAQHPAASAPEMLRGLDTADLVIGARARTGTDMPIHRRVSNRLSDAVVSVLTGLRVLDSQSGFRAVRADLLRSVRPKGNRFDFETELLVLALRGGFTVTRVAIPTIYAGTSNFRNVRDTALLAQVMLRLAVTAWD